MEFYVLDSWYYDDVGMCLLDIMSSWSEVTYIKNYDMK